MSPPAGVPKSEGREAKLEHSIKLGRKLMKNGRYDAAVKYFGRAKEVGGDQFVLDALIEECRKKKSEGDNR